MPSLVSTRALALALPFALTLAACDSTGGGTSADASVYATANPAGLDSDGVVRLSADLTAAPVTFGGILGVTSVQSLVLDDNGDGFLTADLAGTLGAILFVPNLCEETEGECANVSTAVGAGTRVIAGAATGLIAPKGIINVENSLVVADNGGAGAIRVFAETATGNVAPSFTVTNITGATSVWDVAYDEGDDRLFVAGTNGVVLVYDDFFTDRGATGPDRTITPTDGTAQISVNLHGIAYDSDRDLLVLTDVGVASGGASATDGQLFTIASASTATGATAVRYRIAGAATTLGNPVDVALTRDGDVYVAEKANSRVVRFNGVTTATGTVGTAPAASVAVVNAESVTIAND